MLKLPSKMPICVDLFSFTFKSIFLALLRGSIIPPPVDPALVVIKQLIRQGSQQWLLMLLLIVEHQLFTGRCGVR